MTQKEKLIELLSNCPTDPEGNRNVAVVAQHLFDNGVVVVDYEAVSHENRQLIHIIAGAPINEFLDFVRAKQEDRIIVLPCKVGDTVYAFYDVSQYKWNGKVRQRNCMLYSLDGDCGRSSYGLLTGIKDILIKEVTYKNSYKSYIGKTVFLNREEAEKTLEDRNNERL